MILQLITIFIGTFFTSQVAVGTLTGTNANEEEYLEYISVIENMAEQANKELCTDMNKVSTIDKKGRKFCHCHLQNNHFTICNHLYSPLSKSLGFGHWLRKKIIAKEIQKEELKEAITQISLNIKWHLKTW